ncbi:MAG TPA: 30S ribosomal protein S17 [Desulfohalobiaceae bacterium]|nr:30S ribosomal protein S17 [Desulfohalobiaceae bacterium]
MHKEKQQGNKRCLIGYVVSDKCDKTVVVRCQNIVQHPLYKKYIRRQKKFMAHDPDNGCQTGDKVEIIESRPLSRRKRWRLKRVIEKAL